MTVKRPLETGETPAKLQKLDSARLTELSDCQKEIHNLENQCSDEQQTLVHSFDVKKQPVLATRAAVFRQIPKFWRVVFEKMPNMPDVEHLELEFCRTPAELQMLDYLTDVNVEELHDVEKRKHVFTFTFAENPYFNETVLKKEVMHAAEEGVLAMTIPEITWKENPLDKPEDEDSHSMTFFLWLVSETSVEGDFGQVFRDFVWDNPLSVYQLEIAEDDEEEGDGEDGAA